MADDDAYHGSSGFDQLAFELDNQEGKETSLGWVFPGILDLRGLGLRKLPHIHKVEGHFWCGDNQLVNLAGAPVFVGGDFDCCDSGLESLLGCPRAVFGNFDCSKNRLATLTGAPELVGGDFDCQDNLLRNLEGAPRLVGGFFWCQGNKLRELRGGPEIVLKGFYGGGNEELESLEGAPKYVGENFHLGPADTFTVDDVMAVTTVSGHVRIRGYESLDEWAAEHGIDLP